MKQVEMEMQTLRTKRESSCQAGPRNEGRTQPGSLTRRSSKAARQSSAMIFGGRINLWSGDSQQCYSLEQEFMSSATIPR
ncbi:unnamed protein product [Triticum turgidum subsp. durum]|uniref:Uncharacterized protein n=1 Tax=Triticum turgidum subsp. durum TaxID=4567 RepID=A0A9R0YSD3_TRITD|nr:unnamed protein product [Triticum turgidum subsp. durum]